MDLAEFDGMMAKQDEGVPIQIVDPRTKRPIPGMKWWVLGTDSQRVREARQEAVDARIKRQQTGQMTAADVDEEAVVTLAKAVVRWEGTEYRGQELECNPANVAMLFQKFPFLVPQVDAAVNDRSRFT